MADGEMFTEIVLGREWVPMTLIFAKGEAETGEHPVDVRPAERVRHGRRTLGFRAERDARAKKHAHAGNLTQGTAHDLRRKYSEAFNVSGLQEGSP